MKIEIERQFMVGKYEPLVVRFDLDVPLSAVQQPVTLELLADIVNMLALYLAGKHVQKVQTEVGYTEDGRPVTVDEIIRADPDVLETLENKLAEKIAALQMLLDIGEDEND